MLVAIFISPSFLSANDGNPLSDARLFTLRSTSSGQLRDVVWLDSVTKAVYITNYKYSLLQKMFHALFGRLPFYDESRHRPKDQWSRKAVVLLQPGQLDIPVAIASDNEGNVYVLYKHEPHIRIVYLSGKSTTLSLPALSEPTDICVIAKHIYVSDRGLHAIASTTLAGPPKMTYFRDDVLEIDRLLPSNGELRGINKKDKKLFRLFLSPEGDVKGSYQVTALDVSEVTDALSVHDNVYILDGLKNILFVASIAGGPSVHFNLEGLVSHPISISGDATYIAFGGKGGEITTFRRVAPGFVYFPQPDASDKMAHFYDYLRKRQLLPTTARKVAQHTTLGELTASQFPYGYFESVGELICRLNPGRDCDALLNRGVEAGSTVAIPDLQVSTIQDQKTVSIDKALAQQPTYTDGGWTPPLTLERLITDEWNQAPGSEDLRKINYFYSGPNILSQTTGSFVVPVDTVRIATLVSVSPNSPTTKRLKKKKQLSIPGEYSFRPNAEALTEPDLGGRADREEEAQASNDTEDLCDHVSEGLIGRPLELLDFCVPVQAKPQLYPRVGNPDVAVVDLAFSSDHPEFVEEAGTSNVTIDGNPDVLHRNKREFDIEIDHGTHMLGLITARGKLGQTIGVFPHEKVLGIHKGDFQEYERHHSTPKIYSISLGEPDYFAPPLEWSSTLEHYQHLFVVAAGNEPGPLAPNSLATNGKYSNVITVGASTVPPETFAPAPHDSSHLGYSFQREYVSIVAPGAEIRSTLVGGGFGIATGTSPATALVAGVAAELSVLKSDWYPWQLKERILSTAEVSPWMYLYSDAVGFGLLNAKRALLNPDDVVFWLHTSRDSKPPKKLLDTDRCVGRLTNEDEKLIIRNKIIKHKDLRRITRNPFDKLTFTVFYSEEHTLGNPLSRMLERLLNVGAGEFGGSLDIRLAPINHCREILFNVTEIDDAVFPPKY